MKIENPLFQITKSMLIRFYVGLFIALLGSSVWFSLLFIYTLSLIWFFVTLMAIMAIALCTLFFFKQKSYKRNDKIFVVIAVLLIYILPQIIGVSYIENEYLRIKKPLLQEYRDCIGNGREELNSSWDILVSFDSDFERTYGNMGAVKQNDVVEKYYDFFAIFTSITMCYVSHFDGYNKLIISQGMGECGEFALAAKFLLKDVTGSNTRIVSFEGIDHALPEIEIDNVWWVFDLVYTTPYYPVEAANYASHLNSSHLDLSNYLANLKNIDTGETLLAEHGFIPSNLTISVIRDITNIPSDDEPATNAEVEIFAFQNQYDPLVAKGGTDNWGNYSVTLKSGKEYLILAKEGKLIGLARINLSSPYESIVVHLHKYA
jgi:hypothetical protein